MRISEWSSYVCSSDLAAGCRLPRRAARRAPAGPGLARRRAGRAADRQRPDPGDAQGRRGAAAGQRATAPARGLVRSRRQARAAGGADARGRRSEEHTSELQSLMRISYAVFCLKKKKNTQTCTDKKKQIRLCNKTHT